MHRVDAFGNSPGVCRKLAEGIGSLSGWRKGVRQKKIETRRKIIGVGSRWKFARRFAKGIGKLVGNTKGDRRVEDQRTCRKIARGCQSMQEIRVTASRCRRVNRPDDGWTTCTTDYGRRPMADGG
ncbi:hypothetical protein GW17_00053401 [Ensete ventricosum]|nr:hypothetical protein GW17_00053401 [Ensete ventricosum]